MIKNQLVLNFHNLWFDLEEYHHRTNYGRGGPNQTYPIFVGDYTVCPNDLSAAAAVNFLYIN